MRLQDARRRQTRCQQLGLHALDVLGLQAVEPVMPDLRYQLVPDQLPVPLQR
jgi:hypothetical protein